MKTKTKKILKISIISLLILSVFGIIIYIFVDWTFPSWIYISGSSTMQPLLSKISEQYKPSEIICDAGGSSTGISDIVNNKKDLAAVSKNISTKIAGLPSVNGFKSEKGQYENVWEKNKFKTITIAYDGIALVYKPENNFNLNITKENISKIYDIFAGNQQFFLSDLDPNINLSNNNNNKIKPFARNGGASVSGTAEAFLDDSGFKDLNLSLTTKSSLKTGNYGKLTITTPESNLQTWTEVKNYKNNANECLITYLSSGFVKNNYQEIINSGFKVATYNNISLIDDKTNELNVSSGYNWYRPFNLIFSLNNKNVKNIMNFLYWYLKEIINKNSSIYKLVLSEGYVPISAIKIKTMFPNNNTIESDYELIKSQYTERQKVGIWYGAY